MIVEIRDQILSSNSPAVVGQLTENHFGAIAVNNFGFNYFVEHVDQLGLTNIRFPGGEVSEAGYVVDGRIRLGSDQVNFDAMQGDRAHFAFDLTHPELISPVALEYDELNHLLRDDVATFSQALDLAVSRGVNLSLVVPVDRYYLGADFADPSVRQAATDLARADVAIFLERLKSGNFNSGVLPEVISFDIGNEAYANPIEYAVIAEAMISEFTAQLQGSEIAYELNFQMGRGSFEFNNLLSEGYFDKFFDAAIEPIPGLEGLDYLFSDSLSFAERQVAIDRMLAGILGDTVQHIDGLRHHALGVNSDTLANIDRPINHRDAIVDFWASSLHAYGIDQDGFNYYVSAWTTSTNDAGGQPYALSGAPNTLELFAYFMEMGVDSAAAWGITSEFRYREDMSSTTVTDRLSDFLSPQAAILQLLTDNVIESDFLGAEGQFSNGQMRYYYETDDGFTVFLTVGGLGGETLQMSFDLGILSDVETVTVTNLDVADGTYSGASRLTEAQLDVESGRVLIEFDQSHEVAMLTINKADSARFQALEQIEQIFGHPFASPLELNFVTSNGVSTSLLGGLGTDIIIGSADNEILHGGGGHSSLMDSERHAESAMELGRGHGDFMFGGAGDDTLKGFAGNDLLDGGEGDDTLIGGSGFDAFVFNQGHDMVQDFDYRVDTLWIANSLVGETPIEDFFRENVRFSGGNATIVFSDSDSLTLNGIDSLQHLAGALELYDQSDFFNF